MGILQHATVIWWKNSNTIQFVPERRGKSWKNKFVPFSKHTNIKKRPRRGRPSRMPLHGGSALFSEPWIGYKHKILHQGSKFKNRSICSATQPVIPPSWKINWRLYGFRNEYTFWNKAQLILPRTQQLRKRGQKHEASTFRANLSSFSLNSHFVVFHRQTTLTKTT